MEAQYNKFISKDNFILAYTRLKTVKRNEYKEFYYEDFKTFELCFEQNIDQLICEINESTFEPSICEVFYKPKQKNLARPISLLYLTDQIVYQAVANVIADEFYSHISRYFNLNIFGNIFITTDSENKIFFFERWKVQWKKFNKNIEKFYKEDYKYCANFDIASFYDNIDISILCDILKQYNIEDKLIAILKKCLIRWTNYPTSKFNFEKSCGIPQGPITSALFAEIYLLKIDNEMREKENIKYFRYADDFIIMSKSEQQCKKMVVNLDLLARDLSLTPQSEKIKIEYIENINKYINSITSKFSNITKEYEKNEKKLNKKTHNQLKKHFLLCFENGDINKTILRFAFFKLNKDDEIKNIIIKNISQLELFYEGVIFYFNKHYSKDKDFEQYIITYLSGDTVLFQYNKSLLFAKYDFLEFKEDIFYHNNRSIYRFWIVQYQMLDWLCKCEKHDLCLNFYDGSNHYIKRKINKIKFNDLKTEINKKIFLKTLMADTDVLLSLQGYYLWNQEFIIKPEEITINNSYMRKIINGMETDYFYDIMDKKYKLIIPQKFMNLCKNPIDRYKELKKNLRDHINYIDMNPSSSLMSLDLFHNILFDIICEDRSFKKGDFGSCLSQIDVEFPLTYCVFKEIHDARNQKTEAHYKDKNSKIRIKINNSEYKTLLEAIKLKEAYREIFEHYNK